MYFSLSVLTVPWRLWVKQVRCYFDQINGYLMQIYLKRLIFHTNAVLRNNHSEYYVDRINKKKILTGEI